MSIHSASRRRDGAALDVEAETPEAQSAGGRQSLTGSADREGMTPIWFDYLVVVGCSAVLSFGGVGLLFAILGRFSTEPVLLLGAAGTVACTILGRPGLRLTTAQSPAKVTVPALGMCFVAVSVVIWNSLYIAHHVQVTSDPGVYATAGRWLASHHSLVVPGLAPWSRTGLVTLPVSGGMYGRPNGTLQFQFAHLLPSLLAEGHWLGGDALMFRVPAGLSAIALCAIYATGCRLVRRPWLVLAAVTGLAVSLPQLYFSRDTFSEPATQVLLWGGIWLLLRAYETRRATVALVAGLAIGGTLMTRIDAVVYLIPLPLLAAAGWLASRSHEDRRSLLRVYAAVVVGVVPTAILGTIDVQRRSNLYYEALRHQLLHLYLLIGLSSVVAVIVIFLRARQPRVGAWLQAQRKRLSIATAWIIASVFVVAWSLRPAGPTRPMSRVPGAYIASLQQSQNLPVHPETYAEQTVQWVSWYLGPITLALAIAGLCILAVLAIRRGSPAAVVVLLMAGPLTAVYLWAPSINPYQIWAMRRYVPASLPLLVLAAAVTLDYAASASTRLLGGNPWPRRILAAGAFGIIAFPLGTTLPVGKFEVQSNYLPLIQHTCKTVGPDAAVLFVKDDFQGLTLMQTLRDWCGVTASQLTGPVSGQQLHTAAAAFRSQGKTLWLLGNESAIQQADPALKPVLIGSATSPRDLEAVVDRPAQHYGQTTLAIFGAKVPAGA